MIPYRRHKIYRRLRKKLIYVNLQENKTYDKNETKSNNEYRIAFYTAVLALTAVISAAIAAFTLKSINGQLKAMGDSDRTTRDSFQLVQRAFVIVSDLSKTVIRDEGGAVKSVQFSPIIENTGTTPTRNMKVITINPFQYMWSRLRTYIEDVPPPPEDYLDTDANKNAVNPIYYTLGPKLQLHGLDDGFPIDGVTFDGILSGRIGRYYYGVITYNDIFEGSKIHVTKYCYAINNFSIADGTVKTGFPMSGRSVTAPSIMPMARLCRHWNCTDDECDRDKQEYENELRAKAAAYELRSFWPPFASPVK